MKKIKQLIEGISFSKQFGPPNIKLGKPLSLAHDLYKYFEKDNP